MTIYELTNQLHSLSVAGYFNGEKRTEKWLRTYIQAMFRSGVNSLVMEIALPDGRWLFEVDRWREGGHDQYGYTIPETRDQENRLYEKLGIVSAHKEGGANNDAGV